MDDTPFINDGADTSLRKTVSLLNKIEAKTGRLNGLDNDPWVYIPDLTMSHPDVDYSPVFTGYYRFDGVNRWGSANTGSYDVTYLTREAVDDYYVFKLMLHDGLTNQEVEFAYKESPLLDFPTSMDPSGGTIVSGSLLFNTEQRESYSVRVTNPVNVILPPVPTSTVTKVRSVDSAGDDLLGSRSDSAATTDTGTFSVLAFIKRGLQNWTTLLAKIPNLVSGRIPVDGSGVTQPVSGTVTVNDMTSGNAKTKIVDSTGADVSYIPAGTAGTPSSSVLSVQGISGGTVIGINSSHVGDGIQAYLNDHGNDIPVSGTVSIIDTSSIGATPTNFSSLTYATISASNVSRKGLTIFNEGPGLLYVTLGTSTTTSSSFTVRMSAGDYYEVPFGYIGLVGGIFGTAGNARVTEIT